MKKMGLFLAGIMALILMAGNSAYAISVSSPYDLTNWNNSTFQIWGDDVVVNNSYNGTDTVITFQWEPGSGNQSTATGVDMFGFNNSTTPLTVDAAHTTSGWSETKNCVGPNAGFGSFACFVKDPGSTDGISGPVTLAFAGDLTGNFFRNSHDSIFIAHVRYGNIDCSGFVSDGNYNASTDQSGTSSCGGTSVPEPASILLLGSGLICLAIWGRKKTVLS